MRLFDDWLKRILAVVWQSWCSGCTAFCACYLYPGSLLHFQSSCKINFSYSTHLNLKGTHSFFFSSSKRVVLNMLFSTRDSCTGQKQSIFCVLDLRKHQQGRSWCFFLHKSKLNLNPGWNSMSSANRCKGKKQYLKVTKIVPKIEK